MRSGTLKRTVFFTDSRAKSNVTVFDTTLRDGEQTPGISFAREEKLGIAEHLSDIGVHTIEAGFPASSDSERDIVKAIRSLGLNAEICGLARSLKADVDACIDCDVDMVHVFIPTSDVQREYIKDREQVLAATGGIITYVRDHLDRVCSRHGCHEDRPGLPDRGIPCRGGRRGTIINVPDTVGVITPTAMKRAHHPNRPGGGLSDRCPLPQRLRACGGKHHRGGQGGASQVQVTVNGIGERAETLTSRRP